MRKANAEIHRQPGPRVRRTVAVEGEVRADRAAPAERQEHEVLSRHDQPAAAKKTSPAEKASRPPSDRDRTNRPASSSASKRPSTERSRRLTRIAWPMPAARCSQARRVALKPLPQSHTVISSAIRLATA